MWGVTRILYSLLAKVSGYQGRSPWLVSGSAVLFAGGGRCSPASALPRGRLKPRLRQRPCCWSRRHRRSGEVAALPAGHRSRTGRPDAALRWARQGAGSARPCRPHGSMFPWVKRTFSISTPASAAAPRVRSTSRPGPRRGPCRSPHKRAENSSARKASRMITVTRAAPAPYPRRSVPPAFSAGCGRGGPCAVACPPRARAGRACRAAHRHS